MSKHDVGKSIGRNFERYLMNRFPDLKYVGDEDKNVPDFWNPRYGFWVEAKAGNEKWGVRIKGYQVRKFREIPEPVVYAAGLHDFCDAKKRLTELTEDERQGCLDKSLNFKEVNFITKDFMTRLWQMEKRRNQKNTISYCMIKKSVINNIFENRWFSRFGRVVSPERYYNFSYEGLRLMRDPHLHSYWRAILDPEKDQPVVDMLMNYEVAIDDIAVGGLERRRT
jgi:hypothetical protein